MHHTQITQFRSLIWEYYQSHKRPMPWRDDPNPYSVVVSEIMLQQTQVSRVMVKFPEFVKQFPTFHDLSESSLESVLWAWQGMGYNRRARYLWLIAKKICEEYEGILPHDPETLVTFPGIGKGTAGSIAAFAYNIPTIFVETNIRRVFLHHFFADRQDISDQELMPWIEQALDRDNPREWYYALMDYGTYLKTQVPNPNRRSKHYVRQSRFEGSNREVRSKILKLLLANSYREVDIQGVIKDPRVLKNLQLLEQEGLIIRVGDVFKIANS